MAKKESTFLNMVLTLFLVTAIAALALGAVYNVTKEPIALADKKKLNEALSNVLPSFDDIKRSAVMPVGATDSLIIYNAMKEGKIIGTAIKTYTDIGFSGRFTAMVGFLPDGTINGAAVLEHKETPGLGDKMEKRKSDFPLQFNGIHPDKINITVKKDGGEIDAITAATISSRAFCDAVNRANAVYTKKQGGQE